MQRGRAVKAVVIGLAIIAGLLVGAPTASAHETLRGIYLCGSDYNDRCGYGGVTNAHLRAYSCDTHADGYGLRTYYRLQNGRTGHVDDGNGSRTGCSAHLPSLGTPDPSPIVWYQVCWKRSPAWICKTGPSP
jgi:hypothetical protein